MTTQPVVQSAPAAFQQARVELSEAGRMRDRHHEVAPRVAHQPFDLALVVALARPSEAVGEQIVRLQLAEDPSPLPPAIAQDARYRQLEVVVEDRAWHPAEELEADVVSFAEGFRALPGIGLHQAGVAVRQVHRKEVDLPLLPADHRQRFAAQAQAEKVIRGRKLRVDTTVVETNIHYPTDSAMLGDGVRVLTRIMRQITEVAGDMGEKVRDRQRSVGHRLIEIGRASRGRGPQVQKKLEQGYRKLLDRKSTRLNS